MGFLWGVCSSYSQVVVLRSPLTTIGSSPLRIFRCQAYTQKTHLALSSILSFNDMQRRAQSTKDDSQNESSSSVPPTTKESKSSSRVHRFQQLVHSDSIGGWEQSWEQGLTPWDLGQPTPILVHLHQTNALPKGRALVPGCGTGYDVVAVACPERHVVGLEISDKAIQNAIELSSGSPNADYTTFIKADFFTWQPAELFDLIFDYTFFCAIEPHLRGAWARRIQELLKPNGELITLIFPISGQIGGPPYIVSVEDYEQVLQPVGFKVLSIVDNELAVAPRRGREKLGRWKRSKNQAML